MHFGFQYIWIQNTFYTFGYKIQNDAFWILKGPSGPLEPMDLFQKRNQSIRLIIHSFWHLQERNLEQNSHC